MTKKTYPRHRRTCKRYNNMLPTDRPQCECCNSPAMSQEEYEVSYMRGADEIIMVCPLHKDMMMSGAWDELFADYNVMRRERGLVK